MKLLTKAKVTAHGISYPIGTVPLWKTFLEYNIQDVLGMRELYNHVQSYGEPELLVLNARINERGCPIDVDFAAALRGLWVEHQARAKDSVHALTEGDVTGTDIRSPAKIKAWLKTQGLEIKSLERKAIEQMMLDPDSYFGDHDDPIVAKVTAVILERQQAVRATVGKVERLFSVLDPDERVRGMLTIYGAHTGRWSGRDFQPHNLPRGLPKLAVETLVDAPLTLDGVGTAATRVGGKTGDALATLMRSVIRASPGKELVIADYGAVEGRGLAWIARDARALAIFADHTQDIYLDMARALFGSRYTGSKEQRQVGKVIILGCGYGMGPTKFAITARAMGVNLEAVGISAGEAVKAYRLAYPNIPQVWRTLNNAVMSAITHGCHAVAGRCGWFLEGTTLICELPSGRKLRYRKARIEMLSPRWDPSGKAQETIVYDSPMGFPKILYGGLLSENVVQALCRDLLADAIIRIEAEETPVVLHVHDEVVCEVMKEVAWRELHTVAHIMSTPPAWAQGFPLRVEGFTNPYYTKAPFSTSHTIDAMLGVELRST